MPQVSLVLYVPTHGHRRGYFGKYFSPVVVYNWWWPIISAPLTIGVQLVGTYHQGVLYVYV